MPHDPAKVQDAREWLASAATDIEAASHLLKASPPLLKPAPFFCQQSVEKALKAFLAWT